MAEPLGTPQKPIVFFDGVCHLCNGFVDWIVARDQGQKILFAPLQGETAAQNLTQDQRQALESVLVLSQGRILSKSSAVLLILEHLPGYYWTGLFQIVPLFLRDLVYDFVARNRYRWFGKSETCRLPTPDEKQVLLP
ncbi:MAG: thiol-disulfide oxidoreductase DCC family protein [Bdellovibrio sp.]|jgi:predicted DCC family thiol-disulfide oxidoreductase YuxK